MSKALALRNSDKRQLAKIHPVDFDPESPPTFLSLTLSQIPGDKGQAIQPSKASLPRIYYYIGAFLVVSLITVTIYLVVPHASDTAQSKLQSPVSSFSDLMAFKGVSRDRVYYISADRVAWTYTPLGKDNCSSLPLSPEYVGDVGQTFDKWVFREYTDDTFTTLVPPDPKWAHLGIMGPALVGECGDDFTIHLRNNVNAPINLMPTGAAATAAFGATSEQWHINLGDVITLRWLMTPEAGPGPGDPSSRMWIYRSTVHSVESLNAGLFGPIIVTRNGGAYFDGTPVDVDKTFATVMQTFDESLSPLLYDNLVKYGSAGLKKRLNLSDQTSFQSAVDAAGGLDALDSALAASLRKNTVNGRSFCNLPGLTTTEGAPLRWHVAALGSDIHTPHWHGNVVRQDVHQEDSAGLVPGTSLSFDLAPDAPGTWLIECAVSDTGKGGMTAMYTVLPSKTNLTAEFTGKEPLPNPSGVVRTYYIASEEVMWDYAPSGTDLCSSPTVAFKDSAFTAWMSAPNASSSSLGRKFRKIIYVEYVDANFTKVKPRPSSSAYMGIVGPVMRAEVGDLIKVVFKNKATINTNMHIHNLLYRKASEGASYADGFGDSPQDSVAPNKTVTYQWAVPVRSGPGPDDLSSTALVYHGNVGSQEASVNSGMFGVVIVTFAGKANPDGSPIDASLEIVTFGTVFEESLSGLWATNVASITAGWNVSADAALAWSARFPSINGYSFCNGPSISIPQGMPVRWHLASFGGSGDSAHAFSLDGSSILTGESELAPAFGVLAGAGDAVMVTAPKAGNFLFGCRTETHEFGGMRAWTSVSPATMAAATPEEMKQQKSWTYYLATEQYEHDYIQFEYNNCNGHIFSAAELLSVGPIPGVNGSLGSKVLKGRFVQYNDSSYSVPLDNPPQFGTVGPLIQAREGDIVTVVLMNRLSFPVTFEIMGFPRPTSSSPSVPAGSLVSFRFDVPFFRTLYNYSEIVNSSGFVYRSTPVVVNTWSPGGQVTAVSTGLTGILVLDSLLVTRQNGLPEDISEEHPLLLEDIDESQSAFFPQNVVQYGLNGLTNNGADMAADPGVQGSSNRASINGFQFCNGATYSFAAGSRVRWYLYGLGQEPTATGGHVDSVHSVIFSGQVVSRYGSRQLALSAAAGSVVIADMFAGTVGSWILRCGIEEHSSAGMAARFSIAESSAASISHNNDGTVNLVQLRLDTIVE